jgi:quercetin dioxygenase-like cupin family protein
MSEVIESSGAPTGAMRLDESPQQLKSSRFLGMDNRVLLPGAQTGGDVALVEITIEPGAGAPLHTNTREALVWYPIEGTLTLQTEQGSLEAPPGSPIFLARGSTHTFVNTSDRPVRALLVCIPGGLDGFLLDLGGKLPADQIVGPPSANTTQVLVDTGAQYGVKIHLG